MTDKYGPMSAGSPAGASMDDDNWSDYSSVMAPNGIVAEGPRVTLTSGLTFSIPVDLAGRVKGFWYKNITSAQTKTGVMNSNSNPRIDRLVLRYDRGAKTVTPTIVQGAPAASPTPPTLQNGPNLFDTPICRATCPGNGSAQNYNSLVHDFVPVSATRGKHLWTGNVAVGVSPQQIAPLTVPGGWVNDSIASMAANAVTLTRPGRWSLALVMYSNGADAGMSSAWMSWAGGPRVDSEIRDTRPRTPVAGQPGSWDLWQEARFEGLVTPLQAAQPITFWAQWLTAGGSASYYAKFYADYLGG